MTDEEINALQERLTTLEADNANLTAERDSLREELATVQENLKATELDAAEAKKLNYTLARQLDTRPRQSAEQALVEMFGKRG